MASPYETALTLLSEGANTLRTIYHEAFPTVYGRFGSITTKLIKVSKRQIDGDGIPIQIRSRNMYGTAIESDLNGALPLANAATYDSFKATFAEGGGGHFRRLSISLRTTWWDLLRAATRVQSANGGRGAAVEWIKELVTQAAADVQEWLAQCRNLPTTGLLGSVDGTPRKNDSFTYAGASAIGATGGARIVVKNGSIAYFQPGSYLDRYTGTTKDGTVWVTDVNPSDNSVGLYGLDASGNPSASVNISDLAANDDFYHRNGKDKNVFSIAEWFATPSSGENFFGKDRTTVDGRALLPTVYTPASSGTTVLSIAHIDQLDRIMSFTVEGGLQDDIKAYVLHCPPELERRLRNEVGNNAIIEINPTDTTGKRLAEWGFDGLTFRSPAMGRVVFRPDPLAKINTVRFLRIGRWEMLHPGTPGITWLPGTMEGDWYRVNSDTAENGLTTVIQKDGVMAFCDVYTGSMREQAEIRNVTAE